MNNDMIEAIRKRNVRDMALLQMPTAVSSKHAHLIQDIDLLLDEIQRRHAEAEQFMVRIQELRAREQILEQQRDLLGEPVCCTSCTGHY